MDKHVIFLRKKVEGENSIEEFARRVSIATGAIVKVCPCYSTSIRGIIKNIKFAKREHGEINHIITQSEGYLCPFIKGKKIVTFHDLGTLYSSRNKLFKWLKILLLIKPTEFFADAITFVSEQTRKEFEKQKWKKHINSLVIYNTYDERLIVHDKSESEDVPIILQIGTSARKNLESTIKAMKGVDAKLLVIGKLSDLQMQLLSENEILFENYYDVSFEKYVYFYNRAKIVIFPTFYEGFGLPVVEAQVMNKPIISSNLDIIHEVGGNGVLYINPNDVNTIRNAIQKLLSDEHLYKELVSQGKENSKRFSAETIYPKYEELYQGL